MTAPTLPAAGPATPRKGDATHVSIRSADGPRWRAGRQFGATAAVLAKADLTPRQTDMLLGDPALIVAEVADPAAAALAR